MRLGARISILMKVGWLHGISHVWMWRQESSSFASGKLFRTPGQKDMDLGVDITKFSSHKTIIEFLEVSCQFTRRASCY